MAIREEERLGGSVFSMSDLHGVGHDFSHSQTSVRGSFICLRQRSCDSPLKRSPGRVWNLYKIQRAGTGAPSSRILHEIRQAGTGVPSSRILYEIRQAGKGVPSSRILYEIRQAGTRAPTALDFHQQRRFRGPQKSHLFCKPNSYACACRSARAFCAKLCAA